MNIKTVFVLKVALAVLIGLCVVIFLSVNKISAGALLIFAGIALFVPISKFKLPKWWRIVFVLAVFVFVLWNISTTDLPRVRYETGVKFIEQVVHIFNGFLKNVFNTGFYTK